MSRQYALDSGLSAAKILIGLIDRPQIYCEYTEPFVLSLIDTIRFVVSNTPPLK